MNIDAAPPWPDGGYRTDSSSRRKVAGILLGSVREVLQKSVEDLSGHGRLVMSNVTNSIGAPP